MTRHVPPLARWLLVLSTLAAGCAGNALQQARAADDLRDEDLAVAAYQKALHDHPNSAEARAGLDRAKLRASDAHLYGGRRLVSQGRYEDAQLELQIATELNPTNAAAEEELRNVRLMLRSQMARPAEGQTPLETAIDAARTLTPRGYSLPDVKLASDVSTSATATTRTVYQLIARLGNLSLTFDSQFRETPAPVNLKAGISIKQALDAVASSTNTFYQVIGPSTIVVVQDTTTKRREYADEVVRAFPIKNVDLKELADLLRVTGDLRYVTAITETNMLFVRDTADRVQALAEWLPTIDKASPEVVVDVEILEVNRTMLREYGLQIASPGSPGIDGSADINQTNGITFQTLRNLSEANVIMGSIPALYYRLLKTDGRTRTLANPHIQILDTKTAQASFGDEIPVPQTVITPLAQGGAAVQPQTTFQYRKVGVNMSITPRTHANDDVTLGLDIELTSLGAPGFDGLPTFGNRDVNTWIRLHDGQTNILAGLIRQDERTERETIPGLGSVPILGNVFSRNHKEATQSDVVILLTPHIIRGLNLTAEDLRPLRMPRESSGAAIIEPPLIPAPIVIPSPNVPSRGVGPAPGPGGGPSGAAPSSPATTNPPSNSAPSFPRND
jgi:general secretion pathway protein D